MTATQHPYYALLPSYVTPECVRSEYDDLLLKAQVRVPFIPLERCSPYLTTPRICMYPGNM